MGVCSITIPHFLSSTLQNLWTQILEVEDQFWVPSVAIDGSNNSDLTKN